jgi:hypothetical protein
MYTSIQQAIAFADTEDDVKRSNSAWLGVHQVSLWVAR